jgi:hypothetical protein
VRQVNDQDMERWAVEIRLRAESRLGEMLKEAKQTKQRRVRGQSRIMSRQQDMTMESPKPLAELGITYNKSSQYQQMAAI